MRLPALKLLGALFLSGASLAPLSWAATPPAGPVGDSIVSTPAPAQKHQVRNALAQLPLAFEPNRGQAPEGVQFLCRAHG